MQSFKQILSFVIVAFALYGAYTLFVVKKPVDNSVSQEFIDEMSQDGIDILDAFENEGKSALFNTLDNAPPLPGATTSQGANRFGASSTIPAALLGLSESDEDQTGAPNLQMTAPLYGSSAEVLHGDEPASLDEAPSFDFDTTETTIPDEDDVPVFDEPNLEIPDVDGFGMTSEADNPVPDESETAAPGKGMYSLTLPLTQEGSEGFFTEESHIPIHKLTKVYELATSTNETVEDFSSVPSLTSPSAASPSAASPLLLPLFVDTATVANEIPDETTEVQPALFAQNEPFSLPPLEEAPLDLPTFDTETQAPVLQQFAEQMTDSLAGTLAHGVSPFNEQDIALSGTLSSDTVSYNQRPPQDVESEPTMKTLPPVVRPLPTPQELPNAMRLASGTIPVNHLPAPEEQLSVEQFVIESPRVEQVIEQPPVVEPIVEQPGVAKSSKKQNSSAGDELFPLDNVIPLDNVSPLDNSGVLAQSELLHDGVASTIEPFFSPEPLELEPLELKPLELEPLEEPLQEPVISPLTTLSSAFPHESEEEASEETDELDEPVVANAAPEPLIPQFVQEPPQEKPLTPQLVQEPPQEKPLTPQLVQEPPQEEPLTIRPEVAERLERIKPMLATNGYRIGHRQATILYLSDLNAAEQELVFPIVNQCGWEAFFARRHDPYEFVRPLLTPTLSSDDASARELIGMLSKRHHVSPEMIFKINGLHDARQIAERKELKIPGGPFDAIILLSRKEMVITASGLFACRFHIGIGKPELITEAEYRVEIFDGEVQKYKNPRYLLPDNRQIGPGDPRNPLGIRWIGLDQEIGIHGTNDPNCIGTDTASVEGFSLTNRDVAEVYDMLTTESKIYIRP